MTCIFEYHLRFLEKELYKESSPCATSGLSMFIQCDQNLKLYKSMEQAETPALAYTRARRTLPYKCTPRSRRIAGVKKTLHSPNSSRRLHQSPAPLSTEPPALPGLINKTWQVFHLSPLFGFSSQPQTLRQFSRSLTAFIVMDKSRDMVINNEDGRQCQFSVYNGIRVNEADPEAVQILITGKPTQGQKTGPVQLTAILCGVDLEDDPCCEMKKHFVYYPILLVRAPVALTMLLISWLERHFDCHISCLKPTSMDLAWMVAMWSGRLTAHCFSEKKHKPVELLYTVPPECTGCSRITYTIDASDCKVLWDSIHRADSEELTGDEVGAFIKSLEEHFYECFKVRLWKMQLTRIGTAVAYVGDGKLKIFSAEDAWQVLRFMSELALENFQTLSKAMLTF